MDFQNKFNLNFYVSIPEAYQFQLSDIADMSQVVIALINIYLAIKIFQFEKKNRQETKIDESVKISNSVKLQGFKDFIVTPNFKHLQSFFLNLLLLKQKIKVSKIEEDLSIELNNYIKSEVSKFRLNFNDAILNVNRDLFNKIKLKVEGLSDKLILTISDGNFDLSDPEMFENHIASHINYTKNEIVALLISYKGD